MQKKKIIYTVFFFAVLSVFLFIGSNPVSAASIVLNNGMKGEAIPIYTKNGKDFEALATIYDILHKKSAEMPIKLFSRFFLTDPFKYLYSAMQKRPHHSAFANHPLVIAQWCQPLGRQACKIF